MGTSFEQMALADDASLLAANGFREPRSHAPSDQGIGFVDGAYCAVDEMKISIHDLGFTMSDLTFDAVSVWKGKFFRLADHLDRWERSIRLRKYDSLPVDRAQVRGILIECVRRSQLREAMVYWIATRGVATDSRRDLRSCKNNFMAWSIPYRSIVPRDQLERGGGAHVYVSSVLRQPPESSDPTVKNYARLDFSRALLEAYEHGAEYPVLVDHDGNITEGRGWNIFAVYGATLVSPDRGVLEGITRRTVVELAASAGIDCKLAPIRGSELEGASELFITSTAGGIMPATRVNGKVINDGAPGPVTARIHGLYWALHDDPSYTTPIDYR